MVDKRWEGKHILHAITGGIAAYKGAYLTSTMHKLGASVQVLMTPKAEEFIGFRTLESLSGNFVMRGDDHPEWKRASHVEAAKWGDVMVMAPLTANTLAKMVSGMADNIVLDTYLAFTGSVVLVPAMNTAMYEHPSTQRNLETAESYSGHIVVPPDSGYLACGDTGKGRFPEVDKIIDYVEYAMVESKPLKGKTVVITAGPTRHFIDDVRFISNPSSGKMGYELAREAWILGANVILLLGKSSYVDAPHFAKVEFFDTAYDLMDLLKEHLQHADMLIMSAAVGDFIPEHHEGKLNRRQGDMVIRLSPAPDVVKTVKAQYPDVYVVGFSAEATAGVERAVKKMNDKGIDAIVYNDVSRKEIGFGSDYNEVYVIFKDGAKRHIPYGTKRDISRSIWREVIKHVSDG